MTQFSRRRFMQAGGSVIAASALPITAYSKDLKGVTDDKVRLGLLHSLTGTFAIAEASMVDAEKLAIEEINKAGGVLGRQIVPYVEDGASDAPTFAEKAKVLLRRDNVVAIVGCYSSALRKAVLPAIHQAKGLLYYPTYYEGQEEDARCMYTSQEATQSVIVAPRRRLGLPATFQQQTMVAHNSVDPFGVDRRLLPLLPISPHQRPDPSIAVAGQVPNMPLDLFDQLRILRRAGRATIAPLR